MAKYEIFTSQLVYACILMVFTILGILRRVRSARILLIYQVTQILL